MIYKVGILGATGRMGLEIANLLLNSFVYGKDCLEFADAIAFSEKLKSIDAIPVRKLGDPPRERVHVWIDFSRPKALLDLLKSIDEPLVIGTTGFNEEELLTIKDYAKRRPVLMAANMSPGIGYIHKMLEIIPAKNYSVIAEETHHRHKKDTPSGTLKSILKHLSNLGHENIQVHTTRAGSEKGLHQVKFISDDEEIIIQHRVTNRQVFARGALIAALFVIKKRVPGLYSFEDLEAL